MKHDIMHSYLISDLTCEPKFRVIFQFQVCLDWAADCAENESPYLCLLTNGLQVYWSIQYLVTPFFQQAIIFFQ